MQETPQPIFNVHYLNIDWLFNQVYSVYDWFANLFYKYLLGGAVGYDGGPINIGENSGNGVQFGNGTGIDGNIPTGTGYGGTGINVPNFGSGNGFGVNGGMNGGINGGPGVGGNIFDVSPFFQSLKIILSILAIIFITIILYSLIRLYEINKEEREKEEGVVVVPEEKPRNDKWIKIEERVSSVNPSDWRVAILEADNMLDDLIRQQGYRGDNLGERMKAVEPADFSSINSAWEAHKVRNRIAHEGSEFFLSHKEARRIVGLYEQVFREFDFI